MTLAELKQIVDDAIAKHGGNIEVLRSRQDSENAYRVYWILEAAAPILFKATTYGEAARFHKEIEAQIEATPSNRIIFLLD